MREDNNTPDQQSVQTGPDTEQDTATPTLEQQTSPFDTFIDNNLDSIKKSLNNVTGIDFSGAEAYPKTEDSTVKDENDNPIIKKDYVVELKNNDDIYATIHYDFNEDAKQFTPSKVESVFNSSWKGNLVYPPLEDNQQLDMSVASPEWDNIRVVLNQKSYTTADITDKPTGDNVEERIKYLNQFKASKDNVEYPVCVGANINGNFYYVNNVDGRLALLLPSISENSTVKTYMILPEDCYVKGLPSNTTPTTSYKEIEEGADLNVLTSLFNAYKQAIQTQTSAGGSN